MSSVQFFIFRHGETAWNAEGRIQGHTDIPLNETGRQQAQELAGRLQKMDVQIIFSSDLCRARETANIVSGGAPIIQSATLRETSYGEAEGMLRTEIVAKYGQESWERWVSVDPRDLDFRFPGGESKREQLQRVLAYLEESVIAQPELKKIAVSTHGGVVRRLIHHCKGAPENPIAQLNCLPNYLPNCGLYQLCYAQGEWEFVGQL